MKNMKYLIGGVLFIVIAVSGILGFRKVSKEEVYEFEMNGGSGTEVQIPGDGIKTQTQMTALAESEEEAEKIADLYQMEFISFSYGVAVYLTDQDPQELINLGEDKGYPPISIDSFNHTMEE